MKTVLVLGANGFIGKQVVATLRLNQYRVIKADIQTSQCDDECLIFDAVEPNFVDLFSQTKPDVCINCTGAASVPLSFSTPLSDYQLNTQRIIEMLDALREIKLGIRFIHLSSAAVYGNPVELPVLESSVIKPLSPYGWHKHYAELACQEYATLHKIPALSLRIFSAYGPGLRKQLFWDTYQKAKQNDRLELFGTGNETRDFIYVEDIARCIDTLIRKGDFDGRAVNVASGDAIKISTAVSTLISSLGWSRNCEFTGEERVGDPLYWQADVSYLESLGFTPAFSLSQGLEQVAQWMLEE